MYKGARTTEFGEYSIKKKTNAIDVKDRKTETGNDSFRPRVVNPTNGFFTSYWLITGYLVYSIIT